MNRLGLVGVFFCGAIWLAACGSEGEGAKTDVGTFSVGVQALTAAEITDACYNLTVTDGTGAVVWTEPGVCADQYGNGAAGITYVGPCDANNNDHTVTVELASLSNIDGLLAEGDYLNPCPVGSGCIRTVTCQENADVQVPFDLTVLIQSGHGFIDIAVDTEFVQCAAKLDCVDDNGDPLEFLADPDGVPGTTIVLGFTCIWEDCIDGGFWLYSDDIVVTCDEGTATVNVTGSGQATITQTPDILFGATVYAGLATGTGGYQNIALGFNGGTNCTATTSATASTTQLTAQTLPPGSGHPAVSYTVPVTGPLGEFACSQHALDGNPGGVESFYPESLADRTFDNEAFHANDCPAAVCAADLDCDDAVECTVDTCDVGPGVCANTPVADGIGCTGGICDAGTCCADSDQDGVSVCAGDCDDGNALIYPGFPEFCDDGLDNDCDGLVDCDDPDCANGGPPCAQCGDGVVEGAESCDDGNNDVGDGCSSDCLIEAGYECLPGSPSVCGVLSTCGDSLVEGLEACDDGNTVGGDGCSADCSEIEAGFACTNALNLNTGSDGAGGTLSLGSDDPIWEYAVGADCGGGPCPAPATLPPGLSYAPAEVIQECVGAWHDASGPAQWVNSSGWNAVDNECGPHPQPNNATHRYYRVQFVIPTAAAAAVTTLSGTLYADNLALRIWINDVEVSEWAPTYGTSTFSSGSGVAFGSWGASYYQAGVNDMVILVVNYESVTEPNPEGLFVEVPDAFDSGSICGPL